MLGVFEVGRFPDAYRIYYNTLGLRTYTFTLQECRGGRTRTGGLYVPNVARYQLRHTPKSFINILHPFVLRIFETRILYCESGSLHPCCVHFTLLAAAYLSIA